MDEQYWVELTKDQLVFSAAHFITFGGNTCERLHGHNFRVRVEIGGPLDENRYVFDFIALIDMLKSIIDRLDHHMLLPTDHPHIHVVEKDENIEVTFEDRRWSFPRGDCVLMPLANTTVELIARYIGGLLLIAMDEKGLVRPERLRVGVEENFGQWAYCELREAKN